MDINIDPTAAIGKGVDLINNVVNKIWPDKTEQEKQEIANAFALMQGQIDINKIEAASPSFWNSGWRPGAGWVCVVSLGLTYIPKALVLTFMWGMQAWTILHHPDVHGNFATLPPYPDLGITDLFGLLGTLLGVGGLKTFERAKGVA